MGAMLDLGSSAERRRSSSLLSGILYRNIMISFTEIAVHIWKITLSLLIMILAGLSLLGGIIGAFHLGGYLLNIFGNLEHNLEKRAESNISYLFWALLDIIGTFICLFLVLLSIVIASIICITLSIIFFRIASSIWGEVVILNPFLYSFWGIV